MQDKFAQAIVEGVDPSAAYLVAGYSCNMLPATIANNAYMLAHVNDVAARIQELKEAVQAAVVARVAWNQEAFLNAAEDQRKGAMADHQWASSNGALKLIGEATGLLAPDRAAGADVKIEKVIIVLNHGNRKQGALEAPDAEDQGLAMPKIVDADGELVDNEE